VNDTYGHLAGDAVLRETTQRMMASVGPYDTVGRYGGEEFLIVVPSSDAMGALGLSERIRRATTSPVPADALCRRSCRVRNFLHRLGGLVRANLAV
jgi:diguanylate cyclase (GGDEF)-like protein